jgi:hypothetical protein
MQLGRRTPHSRRQATDLTVSELVLFYFSGKRLRGGTYYETAENGEAVMLAKKYRALGSKLY